MENSAMHPQISSNSTAQDHHHAAEVASIQVCTRQTEGA